MDLKHLLRAKPLIARDLIANFGAFARWAWPILHPGRTLKWGWYMDLMCEYLTLVARGQIKRLIINIAPRSSKSTLLNAFAVWLWLNDPSQEILAVSYEIDLAVTFNSDRRRLMESAKFKSLFADRFTLSVDRAQAGEFSNESGGSMRAASTNSRAQGRGGNIILIDDPLSADSAFSDILRNETNDWFERMLPTRLNDPATSAIILDAQRLHQNDPSGYLLETQPGEWTHLKLPLIAEQDEVWTFPISGRVVRRATGECLDDRRWNAKFVRERQQNRLVFAGQYQQSPVPTVGNLIRTSDVRYHSGRDPVTGMRDADLPTSFDLKVISVDCAFKALASSDRVAIIVVGVKGPNRFVLHVTNDHLNLDATENEIRRLHSLHSPISVALVEDAANGASVVAHLTEQIPGVIARSAQGGKMSRMMASAPSWQAHNWFLDRTASESNEFVNQITQFPLGRADDIADAMSQCEIYLQENTFEYSVAAWGWARAKEWLYGTPSKPKPQAGPARSATEVCCDRRYRQKIPGGVDVCGNCRSPWNRPPIDTGGAPCDCGNTALHIRIAGGLRCNQSGRQWNDSSTPRTAPKFNRENFPKTE